MKKTNTKVTLTETEKKIISLRKKIDACDMKILETLQKRYQVAREIGAAKAGGSLPVRDPKREKVVILDRVVKGAEKGLSAVLIKSLWKPIFKEAYIFQKQNVSNKK
jgi:chorismate mutase